MKTVSDLFRANIKANASVVKGRLGSEVQGEDFAKENGYLVTQKGEILLQKKELEAKSEQAMTQHRERPYIVNYLQESEGHGECESSLCTDCNLLREATVKRLSVDEEFSEGYEKTTITPSPVVAMKTPSIATYKIFKQGEKGAYQIVREDGTDVVYINFGAMLKVISRDDLTELYRIVMNRYGMDGPEDELEKVQRIGLALRAIRLVKEKAYPQSPVYGCKMGLPETHDGYPPQEPWEDLKRGFLEALQDVQLGSEPCRLVVQVKLQSRREEMKRSVDRNRGKVKIGGLRDPMIVLYYDIDNLPQEPERIMFIVNAAYGNPRESPLEKRYKKLSEVDDYVWVTNLDVGNPEQIILARSMSMVFASCEKVADKDSLFCNVFCKYLFWL
ncbi:hypothetical protein Tco_1108274 [Tanacetum coccineum]